MATQPKLRPILIKRGVLGAERDLLVSRQHGLLVGDNLVRATLLTCRPGIRVARGKKSVTYIHLMFDDHQIIFAENVRSESFYPGEIGLSMLGEQARIDLHRVFSPEALAPQNYGPMARAIHKPAMHRRRDITASGLL